MLKKILFTLCVALVGLSPAQAAWPDRTITLIVPWAPGGSTDILARLLADYLTRSIGQTVIVDNKAGASGNIGSNLVAKAKP
jgi:tripartite-type tricarboxylate transporter receptor subunit TctC